MGVRNWFFFDQAERAPAFFAGAGRLQG